MANKLVKFIKDNHLNFEGTGGSDLNSDCVIISGFALHCGASESDIKRAIWEAKGNKKRNFIDELERVYEFAERNSYGDNWNTSEYRRMYKF